MPTLHYPSTLARLALATCVLVACRGDGKDTKDSLPRDTALANDLRRAGADTSAFAEAADVAMTDAGAQASVTGEMMRIPGDTRTVRSTRAPAPASRAAAKPAPTRTAAAARTPATTATAPRTTGTLLPSVPDEVREAPDVPIEARPPASAPRPPAAAAIPRSTDPCASPASADQRRCLLNYLAHSDAELNQNYQRLIGAMRTRDGAANPDAVEQLRSAQRAWLVYRDTECRRRNQGREGVLWAPVRARCLAEFSATRNVEIVGALARIERP